MNELGGKFKNYVRNIQNENSRVDVFIGVIRDIIDKNSDDLKSFADGGKFKEYIDNRSTAIVTPIDSLGSNNSITAHFLNSHDIDHPTKGEAVLCINTKFGAVILDRMSLFSFGVNYDIADYLLQTNFEENQIEIDFGDGYFSEIGKSPFSEVAPFYPKKGSSVKLGRNNQYLIFDHGSRFEAGKRESDYSENGSYIKMGFRKSGKQVDSNEDNFIVFSRQAPVEALMKGIEEDDVRPNLDEAPSDGMGIQSDQLLFVGDKFAGIYSSKDIVIKGLNVFVKAEEFNVTSDKTIIDSDEIEWGSENLQRIVKGDELITMLNDLIQQLSQLKVITPAGMGNIDPTTVLNLQKIKFRYLKNTETIPSPLLSKVVKTE